MRAIRGGSYYIPRRGELRKVSPWAIWVGALIIGGVVMTYTAFTTLLRGDNLSLPSVGLAFLVLVLGTITLYLKDKKEEPPPTAEITVDWYLSDVCLTFRCPCSPLVERHLDGYTFGSFKCASCRTLWLIPSNQRVFPKGDHEQNIWTGGAHSI